jgi:AcrR family transcriptional regulator
MRARKPAATRRREIADAALRVVAEHGLQRLTARAIADEVGVCEAALFRHFPTKGAMVLAAIERMEEILLAGFPPTDSDPIERLERFFQQRVQVIREQPGIARMGVSDQLLQAAPEGVDRIEALRRRWMRFVRACLDEADRRGMLSPDLAPAEAAVIVLGVTLALTRFRGFAASAGLPAALPERVWRALERLLCGTKSAERPRRRDTPSR